MPPVFGKESKWETSYELCSGAPHLASGHTECEAINNLEVKNSEKDFDASNGSSHAAISGERASGMQ